MSDFLLVCFVLASAWFRFNWPDSRMLSWLAFHATAFAAFLLGMVMLRVGSASLTVAPLVTVKEFWISWGMAVLALLFWWIDERKPRDPPPEEA